VEVSWLRSLGELGSFLMPERMPQDKLRDVACQRLSVQLGFVCSQSSLAAGAIPVDAAPSRASLLSRDRVHDLPNAWHSLSKRLRVLALTGSGYQARQIDNAVMGGAI